MLLRQDREIAEAYQAYGTPSAVLVRCDGTIGSPVAAGADAIRALMTSAVTLPVPGAMPPPTVATGNGHSAGPAVSKLREPAPRFKLPDLTGKQIDLVDFHGNKTLVLFWNSECGFCQRILSDLKAWEARPSKGAPKLLVVSTGTVEANKAMGLRSPLVLDQGFSVGNTFGATGTPVAVLLDAEGKIASEVAAGTPAVLALAGQVQDTISA